MKAIPNAHADRYHRAVNNERACEKSASAIARAISKTLEAATSDVAPELAGELAAVHDALRDLFGRVVILHEQARQEAQSIASAAVSEASGSECYDGDWEEPTLYDVDCVPFEGAVNE